MTRDLYDLFGGEAPQTDQRAEAGGSSAIWAIAIACFGAGCLFTAGLAWLVVHI